jgi:hypothetical protein
MIDFPPDLLQILGHCWPEIVETAIRQIGSYYYFNLPLEYMIGDDIDSNQKEKDITFLAQYTERDWCYELYHQLRLEVNARGIDTSSPDGIRLSGEPSKRANYNANTRRGPWTQNTNRRIPDILLHCPRHAELQIFALEAKRARTHLGSIVNQEGVVDDIVALSEYIEGLGYFHGFFIGLGFDMDCLRGIFNSIQAPQLKQIRLAAGRITVFAIEDGYLGDNSRRRYSRFRLTDLLSNSP